MNNLAWRCLNRAKLLAEEGHFRPTEFGSMLKAAYPELNVYFHPWDGVEDMILYLLFIYQYLKTDGPKE